MKIFELRGDIQFLTLNYDKDITKFIERQRGRRIGAQWGRVSLASKKGDVKKGTPLGDCPYFVPEILVVSEKLKGLISAFAHDELEFLPVDIDGQPGYSYMNVLCMLDALDEERSELRRFDGSRKIMYVIQARYHDHVIRGHHIFLLSNYQGIYISEELKSHLETNRVQGITYRRHHCKGRESSRRSVPQIAKEKITVEARQTAVGHCLLTSRPVRLTAVTHLLVRNSVKP